MHDPREPHLAALECILCYVRGTLHLGLLLRPSAQTELLVYSDADWAGCPDTRRSTSAFAVFLGDSLNVSSPGPPSARTLSPAPVLRLNIELLQMPLLKSPSCVSYFRNSMSPCAAQPWFIVITSVLSTCPPTLSNISAPNILRLIFTLFASAWPSVKFVFFLFRHPHSMLISSPKGLPTSVFTEFWSNLNVQGFNAPTAGGVSSASFLSCNASFPSCNGM
jgi:hypothetical protein